LQAFIATTLISDKEQFMGKKCKCGRLSAIAFGISLGLVSGIFMMLFAFGSWMYGFGTSIIDQWASVYPGLEASLKGGLIALAWGFLEGFIIGIIWAWIYNLCLCCCRCCCCKPNEEVCTPNNMPR
jgi:tetrahydromethanopterin S-methyltransferase subunit G